MTVQRVLGPIATEEMGLCHLQTFDISCDAIHSMLVVNSAHTFSLKSDI